MSDSSPADATWRAAFVITSLTAQRPKARPIAIRWCSRSPIRTGRRSQTLASPARAESREVTQGLFEFFAGRIFHVVYELENHVPAHDVCQHRRGGISPRLEPRQGESR